MLVAFDRERYDPGIGWKWSLFLTGCLPAQLDMVCAAL
jgi:hypothetical protein